MERPDLKRWLPTTRKEMELHGWDEIDVVLFTGDAYIDHPSFGAAVIGRVMEDEGLRVAIVPQPNWRDDLRDFRKMGQPRLFFCVTAGNMDSMVNHYTAAKRLRSDDAYTAGGKAGMRPDNATIVYSHILRELYPSTPIVIGGIEASLRRLTHYDYWKDQLCPSILVDSRADLLIYGSAETAVRLLCRAAVSGESVEQWKKELPQSATIQAEALSGIVLHSHEEVVRSPRKQAENFAKIETESNRWQAERLIQQVGEEYIVVNPPLPPMPTEELDQVYLLPFTRLPHPKYKDKPIPAFDMIRFSVNIHRGCFGGCAFCTISAHQGKFVVSRSKESIIEEVRTLTSDPEFKGYLSDLGGPSANMYAIGGKDLSLCHQCKKPSCIAPRICPNLHIDYTPLLELYQAVDALPGIKKSFVGSGLRYDMMLHRTDDKRLNRLAEKYTEELILHHVSGRLKVAPEHTETEVLQLMRKPDFEQFEQFKREFDRINSRAGLRQQLIPYFISSHPTCRTQHMKQLAQKMKHLKIRLEQVQDFTPTPMTLATEIYYTGINPYTGEKIYTARSIEEKREQRSYFFE